ncbi:MAG: ABC transporter ATP-binding protein [Spirochaetales bacterium]|nr:ABC transporter ATP-binding protein [Spirochaetales bacterium]
MSAAELLRLEEITKRFGTTPVLRGVSLSVNAGEFITLLGGSGCGKTTTLRIIAGLEKADSGRVFIAGEEVTHKPPNERNIPMVFQNYALFPHMNVGENIGYSLKLKKRPKKEIRKAVGEALALVRLSGYEHRRPSELSGGQKQRVAMARAIAGRPQAMLLDEPLGALDLQLRREMQLELKRLQEQLGITFIYITHDQEEALTMSDRIAVMREGLFEQLGSASEIYDRPRTAFVARFVGNANILSGAVVDRKPLPEGGECIVFQHPAGRERLLCPAGASCAKAGPSYEQGQKITLAVRSEYMELSPAGKDSSGEDRGLAATVTGKSFAGGQLRITALLKGGGEVTASRHGIDSPLKIGQAVRVSWKCESHAVPVED